MSPEIKFDENRYDETIEILAYLGEEQVGNISGHVSDGDLDIGSVFVEPSHRSQGIGLALYERLLQAAASAGISTIRSQDASDSAKAVHARLVDKYGLRAPGSAFGYDCWAFENPFLPSSKSRG
jgi:GNAT superfamily N-acetyltransferase